MFFRRLVPAAAALGLLMTGAAHADDTLAVKMAKIGANLVGYNSVTYSHCQAPAAQLDAYQKRGKEKFAAAGAAYDTEFAAGQAEGVEKWNNGAAALGGEVKERAAVCTNALLNLQKTLARK